MAHGSRQFGRILRVVRRRFPGLHPLMQACLGVWLSPAQTGFRDGSSGAERRRRRWPPVCGDALEEVTPVANKPLGFCLGTSRTS